MFDLLFDNRTPDRPELVIQTLNEEARLQWQCDYYGSVFDIVILDGGSVDRTIDVAKRMGATALRRHPNSMGFGYNHHYMASAPYDKYFIVWNSDEIAEKKEFSEKIRYCQNEGGIVMGRRQDWFYGFQTRQPKASIQPLAMRRSQYIYNEHDLHNGLSLTTADIPKPEILVQHLQVTCAHRYFGGRFDQVGSVQKYNPAEYHESNSGALQMLRDGLLQPYSAFDSGRLLACLPFLCARATVALLSWAEQHVLHTEREQYEIYRTKFYG